MYKQIWDKVMERGLPRPLVHEKSSLLTRHSTDPAPRHVYVRCFASVDGERRTNASRHVALPLIVLLALLKPTRGPASLIIIRKCRVSLMESSRPPEDPQTWKRGRPAHAQLSGPKMPTDSGTTDADLSQQNDLVDNLS